MKEIKIQKNTKGTICWKVDSSDVTYNTTLDIAKGIVALIDFDNKSFMAMSGISTIGGIINPGKNKKFLGSKTLSCSILAMDETAEFSALWGVGIEQYEDKITNIFHSVKCHGSYKFKIYSVHRFIQSSGILNFERITENDIKLVLRDKIHEIIKSNISMELAGKGMLKVQECLSSISAKMVDVANDVLIENGITLTNFAVNHIGFGEDDKEAISRIRDAQIDTRVRIIENVANREDSQIAAEHERIANNKGSSTEKECVRCCEINALDAIFCKKCGEKF